MSPARLALLGSGLFATNSYLPAILTTPSADLHLSALWSRSEASVEVLSASAKKSNLAPATHHGDAGLQAVLADKDIDGVMLVLPIGRQPEIVLQALAAGKHVLSEKPVAKDVKTARELVERYEKEYKPKGLIWRVAENWAHEKILREAGEILKKPELGPLLYWRLHHEQVLIDASSYHATEWRTVPDYQGGFILDGGVHDVAALRVILPTLPTSIISFASLHRAHIPPHDTVLALALPPAHSATPAHGPATSLKPMRAESEIPGGVGQSSPQGSIFLSWAAPDLAPEDRKPIELELTCENGVVRVVLDTRQGGKSWNVKVIPANGSKVERIEKSAQGEGVAVEIGMYARAVGAAVGGEESDEPDWAEPRNALWDVAVIEACLTSNGKEIDLEKLVKG